MTSHLKYLLLLVFTLIQLISYAQEEADLQLTDADTDEIPQESDITLKARQDYQAFDQFRKKYSTNKNNANLLSNTTSISVPTIGGRVRALLVDSANDIYLAAPSGGGLWNFAPDGSSFTPVDDFAAFMTVTDIAQNPTNSDEILISTGDLYHGITGEGLFRSLDKGVTFAQVASTDPDSDINFRITRYVEYHPTRGGEIYVVARDKLLRSQDAGSSWTLVFDADNNIKSIDFNHLGELLISVDQYGIYKSPLGDSGSYTRITNTIPFGDNTIDNCIVSAHDADPSIVYSSFAVTDQSSVCGTRADIYKSIDGGDTWTFVNSANFCVRATFFVFNFYVHPTNPDLLFGGSVGYGYSEDGGNTWITARGMEVDYHEFTADKSDHNFVFVGYDQGIGRITLDQTEQYFVSINGQFVLQDQFMQEEIGKEPGFNISQIYFGDYYPAVHGDALVFGQQDGGSFVHNSTTDRRIFVGDGCAIHINRQNANKIIGSTQSGRLFITNDGLDPNGGTYIQDARFVGNHPTFITDFVVNETDGDQVYFPSRESIERSLDFGTTYDALYTYGNSHAAQSKLAVSRQADPILYAAARNTSTNASDVIVIKNASTSPTVTIHPVFSVFENVDRMTVDPQDENVLYATNFNGDVYKLEFSNGSFTRTSIKGNATDIVFNIVIKLEGQNVLVGGSNVGLLYSTDGGSNWTLSNDIPFCQIRDLKYREEDSRLFVFTHGRGAWATTVDTSSDCPPNYAGVNKLVGTVSQNATYATDGIIESEQIIDANAIYRSGTYMNLLEGFEVRELRLFEAFLAGCNN